MEKRKQQHPTIDDDCFIPFEGDLLPCPFCGSEVKFKQEQVGDDDDSWNIICQNDSCILSHGFWMPLFQDCMGEAWNKRKKVKS